MTSQMKRFAATKNTLRISSWLFAGTMGLLFFCYQMAFVDSAEMQPLALSVYEVFSNAATSGGTHPSLETMSCITSRVP